MRFLQAAAVGLMTLMMVAFGMMLYLSHVQAGSQMRVGADMLHTPLLMLPLLVAFVLGFGLGWWNLRPE